MDSKTINISLPADLLKEIDKAAHANYETRSHYIRMAILLRLKRLSIVTEPQEDELVRLLKDSE